jgi:hypothetical protein
MMMSDHLYNSKWANLDTDPTNKQLWVPIGTRGGMMYAMPLTLFLVSAQEMKREDNVYRVAGKRSDGERMWQ